MLCILAKKGKSHSLAFKTRVTQKKRRFRKKKSKCFVHTKLSILFSGSQKVVDHVDPSLPPFLYIIELVLVLNISVILITGR